MGQGSRHRSLNAWRINLERGGANDGPRLVELVSASPREITVPTTYTVRCGRFAIDIGVDFDERVLARLLGVLASC